jgi:predicted nucleic acid-binding Zn ribbon protein
MERAGRLLTKLKFQVEGLTAEQLVRAGWRAAVGKVIAAHSEPLNLNGRHLVVAVEDAIWRSQLMSLRGQILDQLEKVLGARLAETIEFRLALMRKPPQRAVEARSADECDGIRDDLFRHVYRAQRRRQGA